MLRKINLFNIINLEIVNSVAKNNSTDSYKKLISQLEYLCVN